MHNKKKLYRPCSCEEVKQCLLNTFQNFNCATKEKYRLTSDDADLTTKCLLKRLKYSCSFGQYQEYEYNYFEEHITKLEKLVTETFKSDPISANLCIKSAMFKCIFANKCYVKNLSEILSDSIDYCIKKVETLSILNAFKLTKNDITVLKEQYFEEFDEEFQGTLEVTEKKNGNEPGSSNFILTRWFHQFHKKLCYVFN